MKGRAKMVVARATEGALSMGKSITDLSSVTTVGLDLAKNVFQVHGVYGSGRVAVAKAIRRNKLLEFFASLRPCLVGLEARLCGRIFDRLRFCDSPAESGMIHRTPTESEAGADVDKDG
jgi:hypothetical protein